jgi:hypothetical protein
MIHYFTGRKKMSRETDHLTIYDLGKLAAADAHEAARYYEAGNFGEAQHYLLKALYKNSRIKALRSPSRTNGNGDKSSHLKPN